MAEALTLATFFLRSTVEVAAFLGFGGAVACNGRGEQRAVAGEGTRHTTFVTFALEAFAGLAVLVAGDFLVLATADLTLVVVFFKG